MIFSFICIFMLALNGNTVGGRHRPINYKPKRCSLPKMSGSCEALNPMWYHNNKEGSCERFNYGGCGGNKNSFDTREECEKICKVKRSRTTENNVSYLVHSTYIHAFMKLNNINIFYCVQDILLPKKCIPPVNLVLCRMPGTTIKWYYDSGTSRDGSVHCSRVEHEGCPRSPIFKEIGYDTEEECLKICVPKNKIDH